MDTDWSARTAALEHFEKVLKLSKRFNDDDTEMVEAAVYALRRSQDHTAIQTAFNECKSERDALRAALTNLLIDIDREDSNTEGQLLAHLVDAGCIECTAGTTTEVHPRICAYHHAKRITRNSAFNEGGAE